MASEVALSNSSPITRLATVLCAAVCLMATESARSDEPLTIRVATFNIEDVRTSDLLDGDHPRLAAIAETIQRIRPSIILLNEIAYDVPGAPGVPVGQPPGQNGVRFVREFLRVAQAPGLEPLEYRVFMAPSNTGMHSGFDLDNDGQVVAQYPTPPGTRPDGTPGPQTEQGRAYGNDAWGFGTFPGQYAMALLVDPRLEIVEDRVRTFKFLPWAYMPDNLMPAIERTDEDASDEHRPASGALQGDPWFTAEEAALYRLSSKAHWDVPVRLPNGAVVHLLCSHPTPPAFEGPERRNTRRNHDEIRFWADYIDGAGYIVDDVHKPGPLAHGSSFIILGDLNADPVEGTGAGNPIRDLILASPRVHEDIEPTSRIAIEGLDPSDTALWGKRVDYVLPSADLTPARAGVWRHPPSTDRRSNPDQAASARYPFPSDHFPVWMELVVPPSDRASDPGPTESGRDVQGSEPENQANAHATVEGEPAADGARQSPSDHGREG